MRYVIVAFMVMVVIGLVAFCDIMSPATPQNSAIKSSTRA